ncbi:MAG: hypothetical protein M3364_01035 [Actinomycetota bacterium]|nr:hypothetical protein [Actinomycetota bacterium]
MAHLHNGGLHVKRLGYDERLLGFPQVTAGVIVEAADPVELTPRLGDRLWRGRWDRVTGERRCDPVILMAASSLAN